MKDLSREAILRMVGLHDAAHMIRQINAIQLSLEEEQGRMVAYWTEIRKSEKEVTLLAGRVAANETNIGQLQVTAQQLTASVSSLTTTVNGHTTSIGQLQITANQLTASVSSISDTVNGHTTSIGQLKITSDSISNRVTVIEGDYVKEAEISLMVKKDGSGYISNASIKADNILFTFTRNAEFISNGTTVMNIDTGGNLWIKGEYRGGTITQNVIIGTGTKKMYIEPTAEGARLIGKDGSYETLRLGFTNYNGSMVPALYLNAQNGSNTQDSTIRIMSGSDFAEVLAESAGSTGAYHIIRMIAYPRDDYATIEGNYWPKKSDTTVYNKLKNGAVYVDDGYLKVKGW